MRALILGRFQPFHLGHLEVIKYVKKEYDGIIIGIGSAQYSHTLENPFTAGERHLMISKTLEKENIHNCFLVPIEDLHRNSMWVAHTESIAPPFDVVFANNPLTHRLFEEKGYNVKTSPLYDREKYSGFGIRKKIINDEEWENLVPDKVAKIIKLIDGVKRLKTIAECEVK